MAMPKVMKRILLVVSKTKKIPEIIIVVDKLLTGFDEPKNTILYLTRNLQNHKLLLAAYR